MLYYLWEIPIWLSVDRFEDIPMGLKKPQSAVTSTEIAVRQEMKSRGERLGRKRAKREKIRRGSLREPHRIFRARSPQHPASSFPRDELLRAGDSGFPFEICAHRRE